MFSLFLYLLLVFTSTAWADPESAVSKNEADCSDGWRLVCGSEKYNSDCSCFQFIDAYARYEIAEQICSDLGGNLPSLHSEDKNRYIYVFPDDFRRGAWIGLRRINNIFTWVDGSDVDYTSWNNDSPTNGANSRDCVHYVGYEDENYTLPFKWQDSTCSEVRQILCEKSQSIPTTIAPLTTTTSKPDPCPQNYFEKCFQNNACYCYSVKPKMNWADGISVCRREGADMVSIHSEEENQFVVETVVLPYPNDDGYGTKAWIGSFHVANENGWMDGTYVDYRNYYCESPQSNPLLNCNDNGLIGVHNIHSDGYWHRTSFNFGEDIRSFNHVLCKMKALNNV